MKITAGCLLTVLLAFAYNFAIAQTGHSAIYGKVVTGNSDPADAATIVLLDSRDSTIVQSTICSTDGSFSFHNISSGDYLLFITKLNYSKLYSGPYRVAENKDLQTCNIAIIFNARQLSGVAITGKKDFVEVRPDKTVLNVDQNIVAAGTSLYDLLTTSPGVKVVNDQIQYRGGQKALIAINGKPILLSGDELVNFLKNYQSSSISQVELIDNPGSKFDAAGAGGMINIILKKNKSEGSNASVTQSAAIGQKYRVNTGINYNLRTEKFNLYASYGFQDNKVPHTIQNNRNIYMGGQVYNFNLDYDADIKSVNNNFSVGGDWQFVKDQTLGFLVNGFVNDITINKHNNTIVATNGQRDSSINTSSGTDRKIYDISADLNYRANLGKAGNSVLSADASYSAYFRRSDEILQNDFFNAAGDADNPSMFFRDGSPSHITIQSANIDFTQKLSKVFHFNTGIKASRVNSDNQINFDQLLNAGYTPVPELTDHFIYNEHIDAAYAGFGGRFGRTTLTATLRDERTSSSAFSVNPNREVDSSYNDLFPNIQLTQEIDQNNKLTVFYKRNINRPNYQDLNPFVGYVDQFYYSTGNPFLKPEYLDTYSLSEFLMNKYRGSLSMIVTHDYFNTIFEQDDLTKVYTVTKANLGTRYQYLLQFDIPVNITRWWNINADLSVYHEKYLYNNGMSPQRETNGGNFYLTQNFRISPKLSAQLYDAYETAVYYNISQYKPLFYMNAALSYSIMDNKGSIKLAASDIFNTFYNSYHTNFANLDLTAKDKLGSRFITATFTYRFGSSAVRTHSNSSDEQKRLGGSSNEN